MPRAHPIIWNLRRSSAFPESVRKTRGATINNGFTSVFIEITSFALIGSSLFPEQKAPGPSLHMKSDAQGADTSILEQLFASEHRCPICTRKRSVPAIEIQERRQVDMGGRGTYSAGKKVAYTYRTVGTIGGVKILERLTGAQKLPEEAHSSRAYILLDRNGVFHQYREYDENHYVRFEIGYHVEPKIDPSRKPVLHVHEYQPDDFSNRQSRAITQEEIDKYKRFFKGVKLQ